MTTKVDYVVHGLEHGLPVCKFSNDVPRSWPPQHRWVGKEAKNLITCPGCLAEIEKEKHTAQN